MTNKILIAAFVLLVGFVGYQLYWGFSIVLDNGYIGPFCLRDYAVVDRGGGNKVYMAFSSSEGQGNPGCWRCIMLPHTEFGFTSYDNTGKVSKVEGKPGRPSDVDDYRDEDLKNFTITTAAQVRDGNYIVRGGENNYYTVWTDKLYSKWKTINGK